MKNIENYSGAFKIMFQMIFSVFGGMALYIFSQMSNSIKNVEKSVDHLSIEMAIATQVSRQVKEDVSDLEKSVKENEKRLRDLEKNKWEVEK